MTRDQAINLLEKCLVQLPPKGKSVSQPYLAGYVDALADVRLISEEIRAELYVVYAEQGKIQGENGPDILGISLE